MKKLFYLFLAAFSFAVVFPSCSNGSSGDGEYKSPMNYTFLTANRCYIGGSLIWNPSGKAGQLSNGTKIGVRIGHLKKITETIPAADGSQNEYTVKGSLNGEWASLSGSSTVTKVRYEDEASQAEYGYITVNDVNADSISITWTKVDSNDKTSSKSFTIKKGESCDLNGNNNPDLKYDTPAIKRTGYENARWLTFLNDNTTAENTMYYTFSAKEVQAGYRALVDDQSSSADDGLYGVNSNNDFIYISNSGSTAFDYAYGDYVVCMPDAYTEPKFEDLVEIPDDNEYYDVWGDTATDNTNVDLSFGGKAYVAGRDNNLLNQEQFANFAIEYAYEIWQFPDQENGPRALYSDLAENEAVKNCLGDLPSDAAAAITQINSKLTDTAFFNALVVAKSSFLTDEEKSSCLSAWASAAGDEKTKRKYCRIFIDEFYDESPDAVIEAPELGTIYPSMVLNVGSIDAVDESLNTLQHSYTEDLTGGDRKINSKYNEFVANRKKIRDEWAKFRHVDLTSVVMLSSASGNRNLNPKKAGFNLGLGVKLTASNPSGRIKVEAGSAIFLDLDLSLDSLNAAVDTMTANAAGKSMEKLLKKFFKSPKCEVKMADVQIAGPLPFVVGAAIKFGFNINLGNWNPHICFCGLYGAESNVEVEYGVNWFCKPYIRGRAGGRALYPTEIFVGVENPDGNGNKISFEPWFQIIPSFGLGYTVASVRGSFPIKLGSEFAFNIKNSQTSFESFAITFGVDFNAYAEADIKIAKLRYDIASPNLAKGKLRLYPTPVVFIKQ